VVSLLEDAAHLLRRAPLDTWLCHWVGSVPFALALLIFWNNLTHPPISDLLVAGQSLGVALLWLWMSCWRAVFAGRLHRQLSGSPEKAWNRRRGWRLVANQTFLAASKLVMLPISLVAVFPFAPMVAFYREGTVLADREELDALGVMGKARRLAGVDKIECWLLQFLLLLLALVTMLNVAVTFIILPGLIKMLTGYESAFSRGGESFFVSRLFLFVTMGATWLVFDPYVQAVYCLRCFQAESVETGENLRAGLRRIRAAMGKGAAAAVVVLALALVGPMVVARAADAVGPGELERAVRQAMQSPEYNWRIPPPAEAASDTPWIVTATDRAILAVQAALKWIWKWVDKLLHWIFGGLGLDPMSVGGQAPSAALHWSVWVLIALALGIAGWVAWRARRMRRKKSKRPARTLATVRLEDEGLTADRLPEEEWLELAERALASGDRRLALRAFYLANLAWLGRQEFLTIHPGKTNREFETELRRKARMAPEARERFAANVWAFERAWYGLHDVFEEDIAAFRGRTGEMKQLLGALLAAPAEGAAA
jgi:hypothetical protein